MSTNTELSVVILAAGKGTRMKSSKAKVLHEVFYRPMLHHVLEAVSPLQPKRTIVIVGHQEEAVRETLTGYDVVAVRQEEQLGTGHAVLMTESAIPDDDGLVMILCGDTPLVRTTSLEQMLAQHKSGSEITIMTTMLDNPFGYGRIIVQDNCVQRIVEEKETDEKQRKIREINAGIYIVQRSRLFEALKTITPDNTQGEFYLTDIVEYSVSQNIQVHRFVNDSANEVLGVNSRVELEEAHNELQRRRNLELMQQGISLFSSSSTSVSPFSSVGSDSLLKSNVHIHGSSEVGKKCILEEGVIIKDCKIGNNVIIGAYSVIQNSEIEPGTDLPPFTLKQRE